MGLVAELSNGAKQPLMSHLIRPLTLCKVVALRVAPGLRVCMPIRYIVDIVHTQR